MLDWSGSYNKGSNETWSQMTSNGCLHGDERLPLAGIRLGIATYGAVRRPFCLKAAMYRVMHTVFHMRKTH